MPPYIEDLELVYHGTDAVVARPNVFVNLTKWVDCSVSYVNITNLQINSALWLFDLLRLEVLISQLSLWQHVKFSIINNHRTRLETDKLTADLWIRIISFACQLASQISMSVLILQKLSPILSKPSGSRENGRSWSWTISAWEWFLLAARCTKLCPRGLHVSILLTSLFQDVLFKVWLFVSKGNELSKDIVTFHTIYRISLSKLDNTNLSVSIDPYILKS